MKRLLVCVLTFAVLVFAGGLIGHTNVAEAAKSSYKSGTKSFDTSKSSVTPGDSVNKSGYTPTNTTTNPVKPTPTPTAQKGSLLKGLFLGGMAGLLFGSLFSNLGGLGTILGLLVNVAVIVLVIALVRSMIHYFKNNRRKRENQLWRR